MFQIKMAKIKLAQLLNKKKEKEVLMGFQKRKRYHLRSLETVKNTSKDKI